MEISHYIYSNARIAAWIFLSLDHPKKERLLIFPNNEYMPITLSPTLPLSPCDREAMALSSWLCSSSSKNMVVKIVYPGGHVELHERPVSAAEVMLRNPESCVRRPPACFPAAVGRCCTGHDAYARPEVLRRTHKNRTEASAAFSKAFSGGFIGSRNPWQSI